ncbi:MAG: site-specific integrase [Victivallales bacterium]|nr:site-specific integrase [Victivallales bacterium]
MAKTNRNKGAGTIFKRGKRYYLQYMINGAVKKVSLKCTGKKEAEQKAAELLPTLQANTKEQVALHVAEARKLAKRNMLRLENAWKLYLKNPARPDSSEGTLGNYQRMWNKFADWMKIHYQSVVGLQEITEDIALEYSEYLWDKGLSANTYNYHIQAIKLVLKTLSRQADLAKNPFDIVARKVEKKQSRKELSEVEVLKIIESFNDPKLSLMNKKEMEVLFHLGIWTGLRLVDCVQIKWKNVDFQRNFIVCRPQKTARKTNRTVAVPIHPLLNNALSNALNWQENEYVLPRTAERYATNPVGVKKDAIKIFSYNGFITKKEVEGVQRKRKANIYGFHSFRHSFVSFCAKAGVPLPVVQAIVGHGNPAITRHYIHIGEESVKQAINALPQGNLLPESKITIDDKVKDVIELLNSKPELTETEIKILKILQ